MRKVLFGVVITLFILLIFQYWMARKEEQKTVFESTQLIQEQLKNVGKLVVTEGHFSEVYNYKDQQTYLGDYIKFEKKALVVINADVSIAYDLHKLEYEIDEKNKVLRLRSVPEEEISINPTITFYDIDQSLFNPFTGKDYNKIQEKVRQELMKRIEGSSIKSNAQNRLLSELSKFYILTNSLGWKLEMNARPVNDLNEIESNWELRD
ncbi:DUF4230 domain-containing protein [Leptobacterium flavescens]|uniref:DUF4230 domain-containing protein n=1 Tax=Leptobacterium flavescens TaxID=472055 RepID=A0A6P0UVT2_9FLAO|nr:DUF4230 domain-containing protein [Leptobacterium flavescens]NER14903.1 DUF4230 domain-containing protein [Leptobacterium flavescens]